jgi:hypothetical protein
MTGRRVGARVAPNWSGVAPVGVGRAGAAAQPATLAASGELRARVEEMLGRKWSPEQVSAVAGQQRTRTVAVSCGAY